MTFWLFLCSWLVSCVFDDTLAIRLLASKTTFGWFFQTILFSYLSSKHVIKYTNKWIGINCQHSVIQVMLQCKSVALGANSSHKITFQLIHIILDINPEGVLLLMETDFCLLWNSNTKLST